MEDLIKMRNGRTLLTLFFLLSMLLFDVNGVTASNAPKFVLPSAMDDSVVDSADYQGKVVLVNFWATWCAPCRQEMPTLIKLQEEYGPRGFSVIGISLDESGARVVARFAKKRKVNYPMAMGDPKVTRDFGGIIGIPQSFLLDRSGKIVKKYPGLIPHKVLSRDIESLFD